MMHTKYCSLGVFPRSTKSQGNITVNSHFFLWTGQDKDLTIYFMKEESEMQGTEARI